MFYYTDPNTLERIGPLSSYQLITLKSKHKINYSSKLFNINDKKTYKLRDII